MTPTELSCEEVIEQLFDYLDRETDSQLNSAIERHMARCRDCFTRAEFEKKLRNKVLDSVNVQAPARLQKRIRGLMDRF